MDQLIFSKRSRAALVARKGIALAIASHEHVGHGSSRFNHLRHRGEFIAEQKAGRVVKGLANAAPAGQ